ncbi:unnamed protein product [Mytilus coruscus]|uniref:Uncharacterized protein n=1 Tax=Mytilus coruscus TaxID=42192 RepID=A0A6J8EQ82_MYTCO|nr:unnamed protein product [Mytilus coruscus]
MWFKLLMLVHLCAAFPLKCPEPAQWTLRANGHCADPSKYFCLKNDLINGYSENCTRSDFQQPGRKAVLRGGIDAEICSVERYQPFPIKFYTNVSTNCLFLKSVCNDEGQVVYGNGDRNTDTTCRCDYSRGYDFLVKPINPCFCQPSQEDCSCYLKTCSNTSDILSPDFQCIYKLDLNIETQCRPITDEVDVIRRRSETMESTRMEQIVSFTEQWKNLVGILIVVLVCTYGASSTSTGGRLLKFLATGCGCCSASRGALLTRCGNCSRPPIWSCRQFLHHPLGIVINIIIIKKD